MGGRGVIRGSVEEGGRLTEGWVAIVYLMFCVE